MSRRLDGEEKWWWWCWSKKIECPSSLPPTCCTQKHNKQNNKNLDGEQLTLMGRHHQQKSFPPFFNQHCTESCSQLSLSLSLSKRKKDPRQQKAPPSSIYSQKQSKGS
jgi:hypothetical protein